MTSIVNDIGDGGIAASQPASVTHKASGKEIKLRSFFEPMRVVSVWGIRPEDLDALNRELNRLQTNPCYELIVRPRVSGPAVYQALELCDYVFIVTHGQQASPYITVGGISSQGIPSGQGPNLLAEYVWIGACYAKSSVAALGGPPRFHTLQNSGFTPDGTCGQNKMIQGLTAELSRLTTTECEIPKRVAVLSGIVEVHIK